MKTGVTKLLYTALILAGLWYPSVTAMSQSAAQGVGATREPSVLVKGPLGVVGQCHAQSGDVFWIEEERTILHVNGEKGGYPDPFLRSNTPIAAFNVDSSGLYYISEKAADLLETSRIDYPQVELKRIENGERLTTLQNFGLATATFVAIDTSNVYVFAGLKDTDGTILQVPKGGGAAKQLATKVVGAVSQFAFDEKNIYWLDPAFKAVFTAPRSGGQKTRFFQSTDGSFEPELMVADETSIYLKTRQGAIYRIQKSDGKDTRTYQGGGFEFYGPTLIMDKERLYWAEHNKIMTMNKTDLRPAPLFQRQNQPSCITMDDKYIYWFEVGDGGLVKVPR